MHFFRRVLIIIASFLCALSVSAFIWMMTVQTTLLQRTVVKNWLQQSNVYNTLLPEVITPGHNNQASPLGAAINEAPKQALLQTFPPSYVQQQLEIVIDKTYDWLEGKTSTIAFSIPANAKRTDFIERLAKLLEPSITQLPMCSLANTTNCRPPQTDPAVAARLTATKIADESGIFTAPITEKTLSKNPVNNQPVQQLQKFTTFVPTLLILLPLVAVLSAVLVFALASLKIRAGKKLMVRIFFGAAFSLATGLGIIYYSSKINIQATESMPIAHVLNPLLHLATATIGQQLSLFSGIAAAVSAGIWVGLAVWGSKKASSSIQPSAK